MHNWYSNHGFDSLVAEQYGLLWAVGSIIAFLVVGLFPLAFGQESDSEGPDQVLVSSIAASCLFLVQIHLHDVSEFRAGGTFQFKRLPGQDGIAAQKLPDFFNICLIELESENPFV